MTRAEFERKVCSGSVETKRKAGEKRRLTRPKVCEARALRTRGLRLGRFAPPGKKTKVYDPRSDRPIDQASEFALDHVTPISHSAKIVVKTTVLQFEEVMGSDFLFRL